MKKLLIKVCGLTAPANIQAICHLGVDMLGFIFYPLSPRYVREKATTEELTALPLIQKRVGVFVNETKVEMLRIAKEYHLDCLQLHGQETPELCAELRHSFTVLKAFPIAEPSDFEQANNYEGCCDYYLFDTKGPYKGGNGVAFEWQILEAYSGDTSFFLSGGITPSDSNKINQINHPKLTGLDLNSRFETSPGVKNVALLEEFMKNLVI